MSKIFQTLFSEVKNAGFTLIELLIVVLMIGILAAVALPQYETAVEKSRAAEGLTLLNSLVSAQESYKMANGVYSRDFDALDVSLPLQEIRDVCYLSLANSSKMVGNEDWGVVLDRDLHFPTPVLVLRESGDFKCYGFFKHEGQLYCAEDVDHNVHTKNFCKKLGGKWERDVPTWKLYRM